MTETNQQACFCSLKQNLTIYRKCWYTLLSTRRASIQTFLACFLTDRCSSSPEQSFEASTSLSIRRSQISPTFYEQLFCVQIVKSQKKSDNLFVSFCDFGIFSCKSCSYNVDEIHPDGIYEESFIEERRSNLEGFVNK